MILHYTLCKQCNLSLLPLNMIDCGLSPNKSDTLVKKTKLFFFLSARLSSSNKELRLHSCCHRKWWLMCFLLGNPTPLANEEGIYHPFLGWQMSRGQRSKCLGTIYFLFSNCSWKVWQQSEKNTTTHTWTHTLTHTPTPAHTNTKTCTHTQVDSRSWGLEDVGMGGLPLHH